MAPAKRKALKTTDKNGVASKKAFKASQASKGCKAGKKRRKPLRRKKGCEGEPAKNKAKANVPAEDDADVDTDDAGHLEEASSEHMFLRSLIVSA